MARKSKASMVQEGSSVHEHHAGGHATKASGETHTKLKGHLMEGIVSGMPKRNLPVVIDGIVRGHSKYAATSLAPDTMHVKSSATHKELSAFGSGLFPEGKTGK